MPGILEQFRSDPVEAPAATPELPDGQPNTAPEPTGILDRFIDPDQLNLEPPDPATLGQQFTAGIGTGVDNVQTTAFGIAQLVGRELGLKTVQDFGAAGVERNQAEAQVGAPTIQAFSKVENMDDFFDWAAGGIGTQIPQLGGLIASGGIGGAMAKAAVNRSVKQTVRNRMIRNMSAKGFTPEQATLATDRTLASPAGFKMLRDGISRGVPNQQLAQDAFTRGAKGGVFAFSAGQQTSETDIALTEAGIDAGFTSIVAGTLGGALETLPALRIIDRTFPGMDRALAKGFIKDFAVNMGIQGGLEGSTEAAQEVIQMAALAYHDPSFDFLDPDNLTRITDSFAAGALLGVVMGGGADVISATPGAIESGVDKVREIRERFRMPQATVDTDNVADPDTLSDFEPADNTFYEEVKGRVNRVVKETLEPALNTLTTKVQEGIDRVAAAAPALNETISELAESASEAQEEFLAGHQPIIDDAVRYAKEQAAYITSVAQDMVGPARQKYIQEQMAKVKEELKRVAATLKERADKVTGSVQAGIGARQSFERLNDVEPAETRFTFGQIEQAKDAQGQRIRRISRGNEAKPLKTRAHARQLIERLRKRYRSATDSTFSIRELDNGTYVVQLSEGEFGRGQVEALREDDVIADGIERARLSQRSNPDQRRTRIKVKLRDGRKGRTLLDVRTLAEAGRELDAGDNQTLAQGLTAMVGRMVDNDIINNEDANVILDAFEANFSDPGAKINVPGTHTRDDRLTFESLPPQVKKSASEAIQNKLQEEGLEPGTKDFAIRFVELRRAAIANIDRQVRERGLDLDNLPEEQGTEFKFVEDGDGRKFETEKQQAARNPKPTTKKPNPRKRKARILGQGKTPGPGKFRIDIKGITKEQKDAVSEIVGKIMKMINSKSEVIVISMNEALDMMTDPTHPHADIGEAFILGGSEFAILYNSDGAHPTYILMGNPSEHADGGVAGLIHELGHLLHFDTWSQLNAKQQDALWDAFVADVNAGKRKTGALINDSLAQHKDIPDARINVFEFREWMADQFVDWMANRRRPRTAIEKFMEAVAKKMEAFWEFLALNPGRYGMLNATFADFADAVAKNLRQKDPTGRHQFYLKEGAAGRPVDILFDVGAEDIGAYQPKGLSQTEWQALAKRLEEQYPVVAKRVKLISDWMHAAYHLALAPSTSVMRTIGERIEAANELVTMFNRELHGKAKIRQNYHNRVTQMKSQFLNKFDAITKDMDDAEKASLLKRLREMDGDPNAAPQTAQERAVRKLFDEMHDYLIESGLPVGEMANYFPRSWSRERLIKNEEKIIKHLMSKGMKRNNARAFFNSMISFEADDAAVLRNVQQDEVSMQSPSFRNMRSRTMTDPFFDQFLEDNLDGAVGNYVVAAVKRAEFNSFLGSKAPPGTTADTLSKKQWNPRGNIERILADAEEQGATEEDLKKMRNFTDAQLGMYGRDDVSDATRTALAAVVAYQNMRVLLFTVFASLPDVVGPAIRAGDMKLAFRTAIDNMQKVLKTGNDLDEMARAFGVISSASNQHILTEYVDNHFMPPTLRKWNNAFFKWTGLNFYTDVTRKYALAVGVDSIKDQANKARNGTSEKIRNRAKQFLAELGLTAEQVDTWVADGERTWGGIGYDSDSKNDQKIAEGLLQFVNESIMRPNASQRPILASHPGAMLVYHLKGFIYAFHDVILKRLAHNFNIADTPAQVAAAIAPAILIMALTAFGLELRELITQRKYTNRMDGWEYTWTVMERSGLLGISQLGFDFESAGARGQAELAALSGPAVGQLGDLISKPASQTIPKAVPIVSQLPWARDALRDATPL